MTIGIYTLYWEVQDLIYIGQSQNIERRFKEHINDLTKGNHSNYKLQDSYNAYSSPKLIVLQECDINNLNLLEISWQKEFNSLNSLDLIEAGQVGYGSSGNASKFSKLQVLKTFRKMYSTTLSYNKIADLYNTNTLASSLAKTQCHLWLKEKYPILWKRMLDKNKIRKTINKGNIEQLGRTKKVKAPDGKIFEITHLGKFCEEHPEYIISSAHNLRMGLGRLMDGSRKKYFEWRLA